MDVFMASSPRCPSSPSAMGSLDGFEFLALPPEIRFMVYDLLLPTDIRLSKLAYIDDVRVTRNNPQQTPTFPKTLPEHACLQHWNLAAFGGNRPFHARWARNRPNSLNILQVNGQIRNEAKSLFYRRTRLWLQHDRDLGKVFMRFAIISENSRLRRRQRDHRHLMMLCWMRQFSRLGILASVIDVVPRLRPKRNTVQLDGLQGCLEILLRPSFLDLPVLDHSSLRYIHIALCGPHLHFDESRCHYTIPLDPSVPPLEEWLESLETFIKDFEQDMERARQVWTLPASFMVRRREFSKIFWKGRITISGAEDRKVDGVLIKSEDKPD